MPPKKLNFPAPFYTVPQEPVMLIPYFIPNRPPLFRKKLSGEGNIDMQKRFHQFALAILAENPEFELLSTPKLYQEDEHPGYYIMERIDTTAPLWLSDPESCACYDMNLVEDIRIELVRFWRNMWEYGYAPRGFRLYIQPMASNRNRPKVSIVDYRRYDVRHYDTTNNTISSSPLEGDFFRDPCFPSNFRSYVGLDPVPFPI